MSDDAEAPRWLSLGQAYERLQAMGVTDQTVRAWGDAGRYGLVVTRGGKHRRFREDTVDALRARFDAGEPLEP